MEMVGFNSMCAKRSDPAEGAAARVSHARARAPVQLNSRWVFLHQDSNSDSKKPLIATMFSHIVSRVSIPNTFKCALSLRIKHDTEHFTAFMPLRWKKELFYFTII